MEFQLTTLVVMGIDSGNQEKEPIRKFHFISN